MNSLLLLVPIALGLGVMGLAAFLWALRSGQFDDLDGAGSRILFDDDRPPAPAVLPIAQPGEPSCPAPHPSSSAR